MVSSADSIYCAYSRRFYVRSIHQDKIDNWLNNRVLLRAENHNVVGGKVAECNRQCRGTNGFKMV